jgi:hypothetical protein
MRFIVDEEEEEEDEDEEDDEDEGDENDGEDDDDEDEGGEENDGGEEEDVRDTIRKKGRMRSSDCFRMICCTAVASTNASCPLLSG